MVRVVYRTKDKVMHGDGRNINFLAEEPVGIIIELESLLSNQKLKGQFMAKKN